MWITQACPFKELPLFPLNWFSGLTMFLQAGKRKCINKIHCFLSKRDDAEGTLRISFFIQ